MRLTMISTKGRYALRVMLDLAQQDPDHYTPLDEIATRQGISKKYLEIILKVLVREKLLKGLRGKGGGYRLTRTPQEYTVGEILYIDCLNSGAAEVIAHAQTESIAQTVEFFCVHSQLLISWQSYTFSCNPTTD